MSNTIPQELIESLKTATGYNELEFVAVHERASVITSIRQNPAKTTPTTEIFPESSPVPWCSHGRYLAQRPAFTFDPRLHAGAYYVQEASSMFLSNVLRSIYDNGPKPENVLDLCGAPGGKSTLVAAELPDSFIVSNEVIKSRVTILAENISKWGSTNVVVTQNDPRDFQRLPGFFDLVVVDAPCSGSGLFRKDPEAVSEWSPASVAMCSARQQRILEDVLPALNRDGYLIYSTCSYSREENEVICDYIIDTFGLEPVQIPVPAEWGIVETFSDQNHAPGYRFYPDQVKGEGFFIACFRQVRDTGGYHITGKSFNKLTRSETELIAPWLAEPGIVDLYKQGETIVGFPAQFKSSLQVVQQQLSTRKSGVGIGELKGKDLVPHHELALSYLLNPAIPSIDFDLKNALQYLKRKDLDFQPGKGWMLARYEGLNLGWMKVLSNRINNYYPVNWRILKS